MDSLNIVQVSHAFPPNPGGLSHVVYMLSRALAKKHNVEVLTLDWSGRHAKVEEIDGVTVRRFRGYAPSNAYFVPSQELLCYVKRIRMDVIHAHNIGSLLLPLSSFVIDKGINCQCFVVSPLHHTSGSMWHTRMFWVPYKPVAGLSIRKADVVHCVSKYEADKVSADFGVTPVIVEYGVDDDIYKFSWSRSDRSQEGPINITFVGRLEKYKRADMAIRAAAILRRQGLEISVNIVGVGPEAEALKKEADHLGIDTRFFMNLARDELFNLYSESSCLVNTSMYESFSLVTAEALAIGLPVVVVRPWGDIFAGCPRAVIVNPDEESVAKGIVLSGAASTKPTSHISTWGEVAKNLCERVYSKDLQSKAL